MAEKEILFNVKVDTGNSAKSVQDVAMSTADLRQKIVEAEREVDKISQAYGENHKATDTARKSLSALNVEYAKQVKSTNTLESQLAKLNTEVNSGDLSMQELTRKIRDYQTIALKAGKNSPVGRKAIADAAKLTDELDDLRNQVKGLSDDGAKINSALSIGSGVVSGYQGFLGVTTLIGVENENLLEALTKLQAAQGIINSLSAVRNALDKTQVAQYKQLIAGSSMFGAAQKGLAVAIGTSTGATKAFRVALIATGIGAIVVAIGLLIANFSTLSKWVMQAVGFFDSLGTKMKIVLSIIFPFVGVIWGIVEGLKAFGIIESENAKTVRKAQEAARKEYEKTRAAQKKIFEDLKRLQEKEIQLSKEKIKALEFEVRRRKALGQNTIAFEREVFKEKIVLFKEEMKLNRMKFNQNIQELDMLRQRHDKNSVFYKVLTEKISKFNAQYMVGQKELMTGIENLENDLTIFELEQQKQRSDNAKAAADKRKELEQDLADFLRELANERYNLENEDWQIRLKELDEEQAAREQKLKEAYENNLMSEREYQQALEEVRQLAEIQYNTVLEEQEQLRIDADEVRKQEKLERERLFQEEQNKIFSDALKEREKEEKEAAERQKKIEEFRVDSVLSSLDTISNFAEAFAKDNERSQKKAFQIQKAASIGTAAVQTYLGAQSAYVSQLIPGDPTSIIRAKIAAGVAVAAGLANIAKIKSQKFGGSSGGGGGGSSFSAGGDQASTAADTQRTLEIFGQANEGGTVFAQSGVDKDQNINVTAVVVESELATIQSDTLTINDRSELG